MPEVAGLTDHEAAEAVRDGKLPSPTKYGDFWLFDLRITGTNMAYRDALDEWAFRDPKKWLSPEFVERAGHLNVIFEHPPTPGLNSEEYRERSIGNMQLAYVKGDEVWGVAKIFDADAALAMQTTHTSTSPGVKPPEGSTSVDLNDGTKVLNEGLPLILDHLAVCEVGVWDKDGPPAGIRLDARKDSSMTEEEKKALEKERDDARARADAAEKERDDMKADAARKDAEEKERDDKRRKDESDKEAIEAAEKEKADKAKRDSRKDRHAKHDAKKDGDIMDCARCDSEESEEEKERDDKAKKDAGMIAPKTPVDADRGTDDIKDSVTTMQATIKRQGEQIAAMTAQPSIEDANALAKAWSRWDSLYQALGDQTLQYMPGEKPRAYLRRLADGVRKYTVSFQNYAFHDSQQATDFGLVADAIFAEASAHSHKPVLDKPGFLQEIRTKNALGKDQISFRGDHKAPWIPFMHPTKFALTKINRPVGSVYGE